jgi:hypothetical protein
MANRIYSTMGLVNIGLWGSEIGASNSASVVIKVTYFKPFCDDGDGRFASDEG